MMSKNLSLANKLENHKRRLIVWIISLIVMLMTYPTILLIYFSRITARYEGGEYKTAAYFKKEMRQATCDALCFQSALAFAAAGLAILIAIQGFSYLYERSKLDLYMSVPMSSKDRFKMVYANGIIIYFITSAACLILALLIAGFESTLDVALFARVLLSYGYNFLLFLCVYHVTLLAVMLTGTVFMTCIGFVTIMFYIMAVFYIHDGYKMAFFKRASYYFAGNNRMTSIPEIFMDGVSRISYIKETGKATAMLVPNMILLACIAIAAFVFAYILYRKRPSEAAGKSIAFVGESPILKIAVTAPVALAVGISAYEMTYKNMFLMVVYMIVGGMLFGMAMEVVFELDIKAAFKRIVPTIIGTGVALIVLCIYTFDLFSYDAYVPKPEEIESYAIYDWEYIGRSDYWSVSETPTANGRFQDANGLYTQYVDAVEFVEDNMYLTDTEAICALANKTLGANEDDLINKREISVLYRLKNGRKVVRTVWFDMEDELSMPFYNRIYATDEYIDGYYQAAHPEYFALDKVKRVYYTNGLASAELDNADEKSILNDWLKDMRTHDYEYFNKNLPIGEINLEYQSYRILSLPVYEGFSLTNRYLAVNTADIIEKLEEDDVAKIIITKRNDLDEDYSEAVYEKEIPYDYSGEYEVKEEYTDKEQIREILEGAYSTDLSTPYVLNSFFNDVYDIEVQLSPYSSLAVDNTTYYYKFLADKVPDFIK